MKRGMTTSELKRALPDRDIKIVLYKQIGHYRTLDQLLGISDAVIILYPAKSDENGHWVCLFRFGNRIEFFDPYGMPVEDEWQHTLVSHPRYLARLLAYHTNGIEYNDIPYQQFGPGITTCGRHVLLRLMNKDLTNNEYKVFMDEMLNITGAENYDMLVNNLLD